MEWKDEKDFVCRTKHNLELYTKHNRDKSQGFDFEVTQLINSFLGLIIFIKEKGFQGNQALEDFLTNNKPKNWNYRYKNETTNKYEKEKKSFENYLRHLRNAIAHPDERLSVQINDIKYGKISEITFKDFHKKKKKGNYFETTLSIKQIEKLINLLYLAFLNKDKCKADGTIDA